MRRKDWAPIKKAAPKGRFPFRNDLAPRFVQFFSL